eukprot:GHVU01025018.1.p3 GENE.GHVU01025018.1~~GHVU01025018.1.p3  ORF type:complete len:112 (-),score=2.30 GHVU01025018.1:386-721(-)
MLTHTNILNQSPPLSLPSPSPCHKSFRSVPHTLSQTDLNQPRSCHKRAPLFTPRTIPQKARALKDADTMYVSNKYQSTSQRGTATHATPLLLHPCIPHILLYTQLMHKVRI